jgi:Tol biopolymer transport system component
MIAIDVSDERRDARRPASMPPGAARSRFAALVIAALAGCSVPQHFIECQDDTSCGLHAGGKCLTNDATGHKFCAYPDPTCPDGYRWSDSDVESSISGACVAQNVDAGVDSRTDAMLDGRPDASGTTCTSGVIAFISKRGGNADIYSVFGTGTDLAQITTTTNSHAYPRWSPDRTKIAFTSNVTGTSNLYVMNANGSGLVNVSNSSATDAPNGHFEWSPDGQLLAFTTNRDGSNNIYIVSPSGTGLKRLTTNTDDDPHWSPTGQQIAFTSFRNGKFHIYVMNNDGSNQLAITTGSVDDSPRWSPDGNTIAFISSRTGHYNVWSVSPTGTNEKNLTNTTTGSGEAAPFWSPDSTKIGFFRTNSSPDVWVMDANGANAKNLTNDSATEQDAMFSPTSDAVIYASNRGGNLDLYVATLAGSTPTDLTKSTSDNYEPNWAPCPP